MPKERRKTIDRRPAQIFADPNPKVGFTKALLLARKLELTYPDAAGSLREGLDEMFTVTRLGASPTLHRSLTTTNAIESLISIARTTTSHEELAERCDTQTLVRGRDARSRTILPTHQRPHRTRRLHQKLRTKINPETETVIHPDYDKNAA